MYFRLPTNFFAGYTTIFSVLLTSFSSVSDMSRHLLLFNSR